MREVIHVHDDGTADTDPACPALSPRPRSLHPSIGSFTDLQTWIERRLEGIAADLGDDETMQSIGHDGKVRLDARRAAYQDVAFAIAPVLAEEYEVRRDDGIEAQYRDAYGPDAERLAAYQAEGR